MVIFHSYVKLPEGIRSYTQQRIQLAMDQDPVVHIKKLSEFLGCEHLYSIPSGNLLHSY